MLISKCLFALTRVRTCLNVSSQQLGALGNAVDPQLTPVLALERQGSRELFSVLILIRGVVLHALHWMAQPPWYLLSLLASSTQHLTLA